VLHDFLFFSIPEDVDVEPVANCEDILDCSVFFNGDSEAGRAEARLRYPAGEHSGFGIAIFASDYAKRSDDSSYRLFSSCGCSCSAYTYDLFFALFDFLLDGLGQVSAAFLADLEILQRTKGLGKEREEDLSP